MKQPGKALGGGVAGAAVMTLLHQTLKKYVPQAPRMDLLGMQAIEKLLNNTDRPSQNKNNLYNQALAGDMLSNSLFYSLAGLGKRPLLSGLLVGISAGLAAVTLPKHLGLNEKNANRTPATTAMTIGLYALGGIVAAGVSSLLDTSKGKKV